MTVRRKQRGYLLVTVIITLFLVASIAVLFAHDSASSANTSNRELETARAEYVAQAGMQHALWRAQNNACMGDVTIPDTALGADSYSATITGAAAGTLVTVSANQDAWIRSDDVSRNNGTTAWNHVRNEALGTEQVLTRFDLSPIAANAQISSAVAWFHLRAGKTHPSGPIRLHEITADWTETAVTWESFSGAYGSSVIGTIPAQDTGDLWVGVNFTAQVQAWVNGQPNYGVLMNPRADGTHAEYTAREDGANPPRLEVVIGSGQASPVTVKATGTLDTGVVRNVKDRLTSAYQPPNIVILQLGTDPGADAMLDDFYPRNYGGADYFQVNEDPSWFQRPLLRFDLGGVPAQAAVLSAQLELRMQSINTPGTATIHRVSRSWVEGTKSGTGTADGATWATYDGINNWTTAGGDFNATAVAETAINGGETWVSWEIGPLVEQWLAGATNDGLLIKGDAALRQAKFYSKEETDPTLRPKLTITYACECGSACMAPQGSGAVLMLVGDAAVPTPGDLARIALMESWGYTVDMQNDNTSAGGIASQMDSHDVLFVAESVDPTTVGTKLTNLVAGVVSEEGALNDLLGIATSEASPVGSTINVSDNSHYITQVFATGPLDIYTADMAGKAVAGTEAPGLQTLGDWSGAGGPVVLDTGAMLGGSASGNAAGRRVLLPIGNNIDMSKVNNNGHLIMQRALAWGMGGGTSNIGKILLVVGNGGSPANKDADRKALFESWGYAVTLIDDGADQATFDIEAAANDVVYVSGTTNDTTLGSKITASPTPIVNEEWYLVADFGFSENEGVNTTFDTLTTDNPHFINEPFAGGDAVIFTSPIGMTTLNGTMSEDVMHPGQLISALTVLATIEAGARGWDGTAVPARRVQVPFEHADVGDITADGLTLMRRSIEWGAGPGAAASPGYNVLLIVGNDTTLASKDVGYKALMESWGHTVAVLDDGASQADYDTAMAAADVIYASGSALGSNMLDKATYTTKGMVNEVNGKIDNFGFSSSTSATANLDTFSATNAAHYISEPFTGSAVTVFTSSLTNPIPGGTLAPDLQNVGEVSGTPSLVTLDAGATGWNGNPVPARRAHLPFTSAETTDMTADGKTILQRALEWAAGLDSSTGPIAHWKLDDGTGLTAVDSEGGHDGALLNGPAWVAGQIGDALQFDGSNDYVDLTSDEELDDVFDGGATVMAWIEPSSWGGNGYARIFDKSSSPSATNDGWAIRVNKDNGGLNFGQGFTSGRGWWKFAESSINFDTWQHIAVTYDASSTANDPVVYLDGSPISVTRVDTPSGSIRSDAAINLRLGNHATGTSWSFDGGIDDARIYDRLLSDAEIAAIASAGGGGGGGGGGPAEYLDNFDTVVYSGSDGVNDWSANPWQELTESDGPGSGKLFIANDPVVAQSASERLVVDSRFTELKRPVNLSGFSSAYLSFLYRRDGYPTPNDYFAVLVSDNGSTWTELERIYGIANDPVYRAAVYDISAYATSNTEIQIATGGINNNQTLYVDNMRVASTPLAGCAGIFADEFDTKSYANNDGTLNWAGDWTEIKESNGPTQGDIQVRREINDHQLRVRDDGYGVWREADLTAAGTATLILDFKRIGLDSSSDYVTVDVSSDGGSTWTELDRFAGSGDDNLYQFRYYDITAHATANTRIRFLGSTTLGGTDQVWFDDIEIVCTP